MQAQRLPTRQGKMIQPFTQMIKPFPHASVHLSIQPFISMQLCIQPYIQLCIHQCLYERMQRSIARWYHRPNPPSSSLTISPSVHPLIHQQCAAYAEHESTRLNYAATPLKPHSTLPLTQHNPRCNQHHIQSVQPIVEPPLKCAILNIEYAKHPQH